MSRSFVTMVLGLVAACSSIASGPLPPIADKLPKNVRKAEPEFDRRVKADFPVGTPESKAVFKLTAAGFKVSPIGPDGYRSADIKREDTICQTIWSIRWKAEAGMLQEVFGVYGFRCP